ncbi:MAG: FRG domain-containing protein [Polyangiaceae bacterium]|nr:FRG domain-containing protein [Polyangiaceae bacterium]
MLPALLRYENGIDEEKRLYHEYDDPLPTGAARMGKDWERLFHMQHYGVPTRLLDWTESLGLAAFNAVGAPDAAIYPEAPGIFVLDPAALWPEGILELPDDGRHSYEEQYLNVAWGSVYHQPCPIRPKVLNDRLRVQRGRFTAHGANPRPLEEQARELDTMGYTPAVLVRIRLTPDAVGEVRDILRHTHLDARCAYPDFEGRAIALKARLRPVANKAERDRILRALRDQKQRDRLRDGLSVMDDRGVGQGFLMPRKHEASAIKEWLERPERERRVAPSTGADGRLGALDPLPPGDPLPGDGGRRGAGSPLLLVSGEAGSGKTNLLLELLVFGRDAAALTTGRPVAFVAARSLRVSKRDGSEADLMGQILEGILGERPGPTDLDGWRGLVATGGVILVLDGLDEFARTQGSGAVGWLVRHLDPVIKRSSNARIIISCRDHILRRLKSEGLIDGHSPLVNMERIAPADIEAYFRSNATQAPPDEELRNIIRFVEAAKFNDNPLFLRILLDMVNEGTIAIFEQTATMNGGQAFERWFQSLLERTRDGDWRLKMAQFAEVAQCMLERRTDVVADDAIRPHRGLIARYADRATDSHLTIFTQVESDPRPRWAFTHQALREFVLAWAAFQEITDDQGTAGLLSRTGTLDYEGIEMYSYVADLLERRGGVARIAEAITKAGQAPSSSRRSAVGNVAQGTEDTERRELRKRAVGDWNNKLRNLFEAFGMLADRDEVARSDGGGGPEPSPAPGEPGGSGGVVCSTDFQRVIDRSIELLGLLVSSPAPIAVEPPSVPPQAALRFMTALNLVRCLERLHVSSPSPYGRFLASTDWTSRWDLVSDDSGRSWRVQEPFSTYALRGFQLASRRVDHARMVLLDRRPEGGPYEDYRERDVAACLLGVMERLGSLNDLPLDGEYLWINCTHALIRWLPWTDTGPARRLVEIMDCPMFARDTSRQETALNVYWALHWRTRLGGQQAEWTSLCQSLVEALHHAGVRVGLIKSFPTGARGDLEHLGAYSEGKDHLIHQPHPLA